MEMLVVMAIIGIMLSVGMVAFGDGGLSDKLVQESQRIRALMQLAHEEAILESRELALELTRDGYVFKQQDKNGKWQSIVGDKIFRARTLTGGIELDLSVESFNVGLKAQEDQDEPIRVFLFSSGEMTPFVMTLKIGELPTYFELKGYVDGRLELVKQDTT